MIVFDIETTPTDNKEVITRLSNSIKPPANYKKPETIKQWMDENYDSTLKELVARTALDGAYGKVACIAFDDTCTLSNMDEYEAICHLYDYIDDHYHNVFCGHNIYGFDLPFLKHRSIILGITPPQQLMQAMNASQYDICIKDTMLMWSRDKNKMIGLDTLCWILGIETNSEIDGSEVCETWLSDPQKVIDKCINDVRKTKDVYNRLTFGNTVF